MIYEKLAILAKLNEDLKEFNSEDDYLLTKNLINENLKTQLDFEKKIEKYSEKTNQKIREEFTKEVNEEKEKSKLTFSRRLSDGTLECEFLSPDGETFTKIYGEDDFFAKKQEERDEKAKENLVYDNKAFTLFGGLNPTGYNKEKAKAFESLRAV